MANTYTWSIDSVSVYPSYNGQTNVVANVTYRCNGTDGSGHFGNFIGTQTLTYANGAPFTPFANLTQEQVLGFVQTAMGSASVSAVEAQIDAQITAKTAPTPVYIAVPWGH